MLLSTSTVPPNTTTHHSASDYFVLKKSLLHDAIRTIYHRGTTLIHRQDICQSHSCNNEHNSVTAYSLSDLLSISIVELPSSDFGVKLQDVFAVSHLRASHQPAAFCVSALSVTCSLHSLPYITLYNFYIRVRITLVVLMIDYCNPFVKWSYIYKNGSDPDSTSAFEKGLLMCVLSVFFHIIIPDNLIII